MRSTAQAPGRADVLDFDIPVAEPDEIVAVDPVLGQQPLNDHLFGKPPVIILRSEDPVLKPARQAQ